MLNASLFVWACRVCGRHQLTGSKHGPTPCSFLWYSLKCSISDGGYIHKYIQKYETNNEFFILLWSIRLVVKTQIEVWTWKWDDSTSRYIACHLADAFIQSDFRKCIKQENKLRTTRIRKVAFLQGVNAIHTITWRSCSVTQTHSLLSQDNSV